MARPILASQIPAFFADRCRDDRIGNFIASGIDRIKTEPNRCFAGYFAGAFDPGRHGILVIIGNNYLVRIFATDFFMLMPAPERFDLGGISGIAKLLVQTENDEFCRSSNPWISQGFDNNFRPDTGRVTHCYADNRLLCDRVVAVCSHNIV